MGYSIEDIEESKNGTISNVTISGTAKVNGTLEADFVNEGAAEKYISYQWKCSDTQDGHYYNIDNASSLQYIVESDCSEKWIKLVISYADGKTAESEPIYIESLWDDSFEGKIKEVKLKGVYESFQNIKAEYILDDITTEDDIVYKNWYISSSLNGTYEIIKDAEDVLKTDTSYCGKYIKYGITLKNKQEYYSEPRWIGNAWNSESKELTAEGGNNCLSTINRTTPDEYVFEVDGQEFILLDSFESDSSAFLVMAKDIYGTRKFYTNNTSQSFSDLIRWLNDDFRTVGNAGKKLPEKILSYIDTEQGWKQEKKLYGSGESGYYGGIAIPAATEIKKYAERIGLQDTGTDWWLRTPTTGAYRDGNYMQYVSEEYDELGATKGKHGMNNASGIRPIFYISKDYFLENKLDLRTTGSEVYKTVAQKYTKDELRHLYDNKTLEELFGYSGDYAIEIFDLSDGMASGDATFIVGVTTYAEPKDAIVVINIFDKNDSLVGVNTKEVELNPGQKSEFVFEYSNIPEGEGKYMTAHILEKQNGKLIPLYYAVTEFTEM